MVTVKLHRFFAARTVDDQSQINVVSLDLQNQLKNVLRLSEGSKVTLFDGSGFDYIASIDGYPKDGVSFTILEKHENNVRPQRETYLFASIIKKDNYEWIVQKATELGVSHIVPIISDRTEKKDINIDRLAKIITEAAEQSGRGTIPMLYNVTDLGTVLSNYGHIKSIAWDPYASKFTSHDVSDAIGAFIGPEGGWSVEELDLFRQRGIPVHSLGPQILRAETAVIAVLSRLVF